MKFRFLLSLLVTALLCCAAAIGEEAVPVFWQLTNAESDSSSVYKYGECTAADAGINASEDIPAMADLVRGDHTLSISVSREIGECRADARADYTVSGIPVIVPGAGAAQFCIAASTKSSSSFIYFFTLVRADSKPVIRVRGNGCWAFRVPFERTAEAGATREISFTAKEISGGPAARLVLTYTAVPGSVLYGTGDTTAILRDENDHEIRRLGETLADVLPLYGGAGSTVFSAEPTSDGLAVRFDPNAGLTSAEIARLIAAAQNTTAQGGDNDAAASSSVSADASASSTEAGGAAYDASSLPELSSDKDSAVLWIRSGKHLSDEALAMLIAAASGKSADASALQEAVRSGEVSLSSGEPATPAPLTRGGLKKQIASGTPVPTAEPFSGGAPVQAALLIGSDGKAEAAALSAGSSTNSSLLSGIAEKLAEAQEANARYQSLFNQDSGISEIQDDDGNGIGYSDGNGSAAAKLTTLGDSTILTVENGDAQATLAGIRGAVVSLSVTPTPTPSPTPTPTPVPTPTPTPVPTDTPEPTPTPTPVPTDTPEPTPTPTPVPTDTPEPTPTPTPVPTDTPEPTPTPTPVPTDTPEPTPTPTPVPTDTPEPTSTPTPVPTDTPEPTEVPTPVPTDTPEPTEVPTPVPTAEPTATPAPEAASHGIAMWLILLILLIILIVLAVVWMAAKKRRKNS